jgi:hypothetical protein
MKLYEMPNTVVYLKTQEEYMKMCEEPDYVYMVIFGISKK